MYTISTTKQFDKALKLCARRGYDLSLLYDAVETLRTAGRLPARYKPHRLTGDRAGQWECHLRPDWLMVWLQDDRRLTLLFLDTGTHADLF